MLKSLEPEAKDLNSLAWSLGIATGLALIGSALLAQAAATTVLQPVQRLGVAARRLGEGKLDTRLRVSGTDELADLSRTFNNAAEALEKRVADMSRAGRRQPPVRRRHVPRTADAADRDHRRDRGAGGRAGDGVGSSTR